jgi:hypothetical protein
VRSTNPAAWPNRISAWSRDAAPTGIHGDSREVRAVQRDARHQRRLRVALRHQQPHLAVAREDVVDDLEHPRVVVDRPRLPVSSTSRLAYAPVVERERLKRLAPDRRDVELSPSP